MSGDLRIGDMVMLVSGCSCGGDDGRQGFVSTVFDIDTLDGGLEDEECWQCVHCGKYSRGTFYFIGEEIIGGGWVPRSWLIKIPPKGESKDGEKAMEEKAPAQRTVRATT